MNARRSLALVALLALAACSDGAGEARVGSTAPAGAGPTSPTAAATSSASATTGAGTTAVPTTTSDASADTSSSPGTSGAAKPAPVFPSTSPPPVGSTVPVPPVAAASGAVAQVPSSIAADCSTDVTDALNQWIAGIPAGSPAELGNGACYLVDGTLLLSGKDTLDLDGRGAKIQQTPAKGTAAETGSRRAPDRGRPAIKVEGGTNLHLHDLVIRGNLPPSGDDLPTYVADYEAQHGINIDGSSNVLLERLDIGDVRGDFVYIGGDASNVSVLDSRLRRSGRQGIAVSWAHGVLVQGNEIVEVGRSMFDLEPFQQHSIRDVRIIANRTGRSRNFWLANKSPRAMDIGDIVIAGNVMVAPTGGLVFSFANGPGYRGPFRIEDNYFLVGNTVSDEGSTGALLFQHGADVSITGNTFVFPEGSSMPLVEARTSTRISGSGNRVVGAGQLVLADAASTQIDVSG